MFTDEEAVLLDNRIIRGKNRDHITNLKGEFEFMIIMEPLTAPDVIDLLKELEEAKKSKKASSANKCHVCFIAWLKYKKFKAEWAQCDECNGWISGEIA
uniref:Uncharacterized protein n=1 Tax=Romanomermis culicivorax TaxID=13658 RepID=A0A915K3D8_ROMCU